MLQVRADPATRKCAFAALLQALPPGAAERPPWAAFIALWDLFLQFPLHIIQAPFLKLVEQLRGERADSPPGLPNTGYAHIMRASQLSQQGKCIFIEGRGALAQDAHGRCALHASLGGSHLAHWAPA